MNMRLKILSYTYKTRNGIFLKIPEVTKAMGALITAYYLFELIALLFFIDKHALQDAVLLLVPFLISALGFVSLFLGKIKQPIFIYTVILPLYIISASFIKPALNFSSAILLVSILNFLATANIRHRLFKFLLHAIVYAFIQFRYDLAADSTYHHHLSLLNIIMLPLSIFFFFLVFSRIGREFALYQKKIELKKERLAEVNSTLENLLAILNEQKGKLNRTIEFKKELISILSHDIRTPLCAFRILIEGYEKKYYTDEQLITELLSSKEELQRIDEMTRDLAKWAIDSNEQGEKPGITVQELAVSIEFIKALYTRTLKNKNIQVTVEITGCNNKLLCIDRRQVEIILRNLLSNAIKFSNMGGTIQVALTPDEVSSSVVILTVKDFGVGMHADVLQGLNRNKFVTSKGTSQEVGLGIGLSLVFDVINRNDLAYEVESEPAKGTLFKIWIPVKMAGMNKAEKKMISVLL